MRGGELLYNGSRLIENLVFSREWPLKVFTTPVHATDLIMPAYNAHHLTRDLFSIILDNTPITNHQVRGVCYTDGAAVTVVSPLVSGSVA